MGSPRGQGFTIGHWQHHFHVLRHDAARLGMTARAVEYTLFCHQRERQMGRLYASRST